MKFLLIVCCFMSCLFFVSAYHPVLEKNQMSPKRKIAFEMISEIVEEVEKGDNLYFCGVSEAAPKGKYRSLGVSFVSKKNLTKSEGRRLIIRYLHKMLAKFNGNPEFSQYIENGKFSFKNLDVGIIVQLSDGSKVYHPNVMTFSFCAGNLWYYTDVPNVRGYYSEEKETYEEALRLVDENAN